MSFPVDPQGLVDKLNKSRPLGAEDLWLIEQDLNQQLQAGAVAEPLGPDPLTNPLVNLDSAGGYWSQTQQSVGQLVRMRSWGHALLPLTSHPWFTDLFFSMAGLTSSVASALSELSLSNVDLGSSVRSDVAPRRPSAQAPPAGECCRGRNSWQRPQCQCDATYTVPVMPGGLPLVTRFPAGFQGRLLMQCTEPSFSQ